MLIRVMCNSPANVLLALMLEDLASGVFRSSFPVFPYLEKFGLCTSAHFSAMHPLPGPSWHLCGLLYACKTTKSGRTLGCQAALRLLVKASI